MTAPLYADPAAEARERLARHVPSSGAIPSSVLQDAERQVTALLAGLNDLAEAFPMLGETAAVGKPLRMVVPHAGTLAARRAGEGGPGSTEHPRLRVSGPHPSPLPLREGANRANASKETLSPGGVFALSLSDLAGLIQSREVSPVEVTRAVLDRITAHDGLLRAFILVTAEQALEDARRAEREIGAGSYRGPLHGVPLSAKDLYDVRGVPTTAGSSIMRGYVAEEDSAAVAAWRRAGAVLLGKNTLHEFAFGGTSVNEHTGTPLNPWNPAHMCGGSSGGSAAAVAAGFAFGAFGSETGNSIRRPASFCGVVGLKPTYGRYSRRGVVALAWSLDHVGVFARTAADCALLTEPLGGFDPADLGSRLPPEVAGSSLAPLKDLRGRRAGVPWGMLTGIDPEVMQAFERVLDALRAAGVEVQDVELPLASRWTALASSIAMQSEAAAVHAGWLAERPQDYGPDVLARLLAGRAISSADSARAHAIRGAVSAEVSAALRNVDGIAAPGTPAPAPLLQGGALVPGDAPFSTAVSAFHLQRLWSLTGLPAVAAPIGMHSSGLPMSIQFGGRSFEERVLLGMAAVATDSVPAERRLPAVAPL